MNQPTTSRRDLLRLGTTAAAYAAGAVIVTGSVAAVSAAKGAQPADTTAWDRAFATWKAAEGLAKAHDWDGPYDMAEVDAWSTLVRTPSPHAKALHWKLDYLFSDSDPGGHCDGWANDIMAVVIADAKRLSGGEA